MNRFLTHISSCFLVISNLTAASLFESSVDEVTVVESDYNHFIHGDVGSFGSGPGIGMGYRAFSGYHGLDISGRTYLGL